MKFLKWWWNGLWSGLGSGEYSFKEQFRRFLFSAGTIIVLHVFCVLLIWLLVLVDYIAKYF